MYTRTLFGTIGVCWGTCCHWLQCPLQCRCADTHCRAPWVGHQICDLFWLVGCLQEALSSWTALLLCYSLTYTTAAWVCCSLQSVCWKLPAASGDLALQYPVRSLQLLAVTARGCDTCCTAAVALNGDLAAGSVYTR